MIMIITIIIKVTSNMDNLVPVLTNSIMVI